MNDLIDEESNALTSFAIDIIQDIVKNIILIIIGMVVVVNYVGIFGMGILLFVPFYYLVYKIQKEKMYIESYAVKEKNNSFYTKLYELLSNGKFIKLSESREFFLDKVDKKFAELLSQTIKYKKTGWKYQSYESIISTAINVVAIIYFGYLILKGRLTIGEFTIVNTYYATIINSVKYFFGVGQQIQENKVSYNRINNIMRLKEQVNGEKKIESIEEISLRNISFMHGKKVIHNGLNITMEKGNVYVIKGENGSGKSTLINIIMGLHTENVQGDIFINKLSMLEIDMKYMRKNLISIAEQEPFLFEDTILNNIILGDMNYDDKKLNNLFNYFKFEDVINDLQLGINTKLQEGIINLSGGEKQKLSLIRAFLRESELLILDEPTNALDIDTKERLGRYIESIKARKIIVIVTHDNDICKYGDKVINL